MSMDTELHLMNVLARFSTEFNQGTRHKYIFPSHPPDATDSPKGEKQTVVTLSTCCRCCPMGLPVVASQKRTVSSHDALARIDPPGERERESMGPVWPFHGCPICSPVSEFQQRIVLSSEAEKSLLPSCDHSTKLTQSWWPRNGPRMNVPLATSYTWISSNRVLNASFFPSGEKHIEHTLLPIPLEWLTCLPSMV